MKYDKKVDWYYDDEAIAASKKLDDLGFVDWEVVVATDHTLQLDYDKMPVGKCPAKFKAILGLLKQRFDTNSELKYEIHRSKSGKGNHVIVHLPKALDEVERVAWQAAFGSDGIREALNIMRITRNIKNPVLLFMRKDRVTTLTVCEIGRKFRRTIAETLPN